MNKKNTIIVSSVLMVALIALSILTVLNRDDNGDNCSKDALKFKEEYESKNGDIVRYDDKDYKLRTLNISKNNPVIYLKENEIVDKITSSTGVIYFGSSDDLLSREAVPVLLNVASEFDCDVIYYYDITLLSDEYEKGVNEEKINLYKSIVNSLGDKVDFSNEESLKKLVVPVVIFIKEGKITEAHSGLVKSYSPGKSLNTEQERQLSRMYRNGFNSINNGVCEKQQQC